MGNNFMCPCAVSDVYCYDLCITIRTVAAKSLKHILLVLAK